MTCFLYAPRCLQTGFLLEMSKLKRSVVSSSWWKGPGNCVRPVFWQNMWFMINLFISSIEIELINELFYLRTERLRSQGVFRMTLRLRTGYRLRIFEPLLCRLVCCLTLGDQLRSECKESPVYAASCNSYWKHHSDILVVWTISSLKRSWLFHPQACMPLHATITMCCCEAPSSLFPMKELAVVRADKCFYLK